MLYCNTTLYKGFYSKQDFATRFSFTLEDWLEELTPTEAGFLSHCAKLLEEAPEDLFELLFNRKKRRLLLAKYELMKLKKQQLTEQKQIVAHFFERADSAAFLNDLTRLPFIFPYEVENSHDTYIIGTHTHNELQPLSIKHLHGDTITYYLNGAALSLSVQALAYFVLADEHLHELTTRRLKNALPEFEEAMYATSYSAALIDKQYELFYINFPHNCITSFYLTLISYHKTFRYLQDHPQLEEKYKVALQLDYIDILQNCYADYQKQQQEKLKTKEQNHAKKVIESQQKYDKLKVNFDKQIAANQQLKAEKRETVTPLKVDTSALDELTTKNKALQQQLRAVEQEAANLTKKLEAAEAEKQQDLKHLRHENSELQKQIVQVKRNAVQSGEITFEEWLKKGSEFLQQLSTADEKAMENFIALAQDTLAERKASRPKVALATNKIGHCLVNRDGHFVRLADGTIELIRNLPDAVYLSDNEFIEVTKDFEFARKLHSFFRPGLGDDQIAHFAQIEQIHQDFFAKFDGKSVRYETSKNYNPRHGQIIALNRQHELVHYYVNKPVNLDDLIESIKLKQHEPFYVELALKNGYAVRNILTDEQSFIALDKAIAKGSFIILKDEETVWHIDYSGLQYKCSNFYKKKMLASISDIQDDIFVLKSNQEYVLLTNILHNYTPELGDMIWVDEDNAMIHVIEEAETDITATTIEQRLKNHPTMKVLRQTPKKPILIDQKLLIIGNVRLSERYKIHFAQFGFETETVDGFGSFEKIRMACTKADIIIYSTAFTSHKNSGKVKTDITQHVILCDSTSPHVISRKLEAQIS